MDEGRQIFGGRFEVGVAGEISPGKKANVGSTFEGGVYRKARSLKCFLSSIVVQSV